MQQAAPRRCNVGLADAEHFLEVRKVRGAEPLALEGKASDYIEIPY